MTVRSSRRGSVGSKRKIVAGAIYVAPGGNNSTGTGTLANPYATIDRGHTAVAAGGTVYLRGGTYTSVSPVTLSKSGSAGNLITFAAYPGETPILNATGGTYTLNDSTIYVSGSFVTVKGLTIINSPQRGISAFGSGINNVIFDGLTIHDVQRQAVLVCGATMTVQNCLVYNASLINTSQALGNSGWPAAIHANAKYPEGTVSTGITVQGCVVHDCWGEGIDLENVDGGTLTRNTVYDCLSILIYMDTSRNMTITKNRLWVASATYTRTDTLRAASAIEIGCELTTQSTINFTIANNLVAGGCPYAVHYWSAGVDATKVYSGVKVFGNTFWGTVGFPTVSFETAGGGTPSGCELRDNIIYAGSSSTALNLDQPAAWTVTNNDWASGSLPSGVSGNGNITSSPGLVGTLAVAAAAEAFKLASGASPCAGAGVATSLADDYFGATRPNPPDIGFHEFV